MSKKQNSLDANQQETNPPHLVGTFLETANRITKDMTDDIMPSKSLATKTKIKIKDIQPPLPYNVIFYYDHITPKDFLLLLLITYFDHSIDSAENCYELILETTKAVVGAYSYELAEHKRSEALNLAKSKDYPLQITLEKLD